jgi:hypothetical protein
LQCSCTTLSNVFLNLLLALSILQLFHHGFVENVMTLRLQMT